MCRPVQERDDAPVRPPAPDPRRQLPPDQYRQRQVQGLLLGLLGGLLFSALLRILIRVPGGGMIALPFLFLGGDFWRQRPFLAAFVLGFSIGGLLFLARPLLRTL